ncbi:zinc-ribbon domain-containing protein [Flavobacterium sp. UW10123]|uniref:zinc-ribbon domain-containing protein n=1 Tax=Flavobacterium sp. UW10123 TaxID=3230800 RepID=UPI0033945D69
MIFFYGTKASTIKNGIINNVTCPHCDTNTGMNYSIFGKYAHLYWIPIFPVGKVKILECKNCKSTYELKKLPESIQQKFNKEQEQNPSKTPIHHFALLIIIGLGVIFGFYSSFKSDSDSKEFAENPKVGDVYFETTSTGKYSTSKVTKVTTDSVFVLVNNMEIDKKSNVYKINTNSNFTTNTYGYSRKQIIDFVKDGKTIYEIQRK